MNEIASYLFITVSSQGVYQSLPRGLAGPIDDVAAGALFARCSSRRELDGASYPPQAPPKPPRIPPIDPLFASTQVRLRQERDVILYLEGSIQHQGLRTGDPTSVRTVRPLT